MSAKNNFGAAIERAEHLLTIYDLICDTRLRSVRSDWSNKFNSLMHWPKGENIVRIDGDNQKSILIMREEVGISRKQFAHDYLSELLRAALVVAVSGLDRYIHDLVVERSWSLLSVGEEKIPHELKKIEIPILQTKRALNRLKKDRNSRPGFIVKQAIQEVLHQKYTFQKPNDILRAAEMLGIKNFWESVSNKISEQPDKNNVISKLKSISKRRNQIVHEADIVLKTKAKKISLREITRKQTGEDVEWIKEFVNAIERL